MTTITRSHTIAVSIQGGSIVVEPDTLLMTTLDDVQWEGGQRFTIEFDDARAFGNRLAYGAATAKQRPRTTGRFKYTVVSEQDPNLRLDPIIIIDPPPTDGNP